MARARLEGPDGPGIRAQSVWGRVATPEEVAEGVLFLGRYWVAPWFSGGLLDCNGASYFRT
jgi:3-oxoacyl-[acyl-carrier protein] reductase